MIKEIILNILTKFGADKMETVKLREWTAILNAAHPPDIKEVQSVQSRQSYKNETCICPLVLPTFFMKIW